VLVLKDIHARYGAITALRGVSVEVQEGELVALLGVNGAGKSTTLATIAGVMRHLEERKQTVLKSIHEQGKLTPELEEKITAATRLQEVEDLYLPYKPKKRTRAIIAKERGLEPLARLIRPVRGAAAPTISVETTFAPSGPAA